jgi:hypothetical protein
MRFVETPVFTATIQRHLDDEQYRRLQIALMLRPSRAQSSELQVVCGRCAGRDRGGGKRGGLRVIYYWAPVEQAFYMVYAFTKTDQGDLTPAQTRALGRLVQEEFK